ncbi:MAG TPA: EI24 domain-containing protein [Streptosporangiaceae bacterium]|jgi:CysZ protein
MRDLLAGAGCLVSGVRWVARHPRQWLFGLLPALITLVLDVAVIVLLIVSASDLVTWATPFADTWGETWRTVSRVAAGVILVGAVLLLAVLVFTAVTLAIGAPFYDKLAERVDADLGGAASDDARPVWRQAVAAITEGVRVVVYAAVCGVVLFALGFVPVVGQTVVPVVGACVSGFFLTVELTAAAAERRGLTFRRRFAALRRKKMLAVGFGTPLFLLFLVPVVAVVLMPAAVAGATYLIRERLPA